MNRHSDTIDIIHSLQMPKPAIAVLTNDSFRPISTGMITPTKVIATASETSRFVVIGVI